MKQAPIERILLFALLVGLIVTGCSGENSPSAHTPAVINVSDFGAVPDDGKDDTPAIRAALDEIRNINKKSVLCFAGGTYGFYSASASKANYPVVAIHKQWDFVTPDKKQIPDVCQNYDPVKDITRRCPNPLNEVSFIGRIDENRIELAGNDSQYKLQNTIK